MFESKKPHIGVASIIRKNWKVLMGKRKSKHGNNTRWLGGGKLEFWETILACIRREVKEEINIEIQKEQIIGFTNDIYTDEVEHGLTIFVLCDYKQGEIKAMEPDKCEKRERFERENLPAPLFFPVENLIKSWFHPFDNPHIIFSE